MTTMQNNFVTRDTQNTWNANMNPPNPRDTVMAMEDGFTMYAGAFGGSIPMTNYNDAELGIESQTFEAEEDETEVSQPAENIPGMQVQPETPTTMEAITNLAGTFNDWIKENLGYVILGTVMVGSVYYMGKTNGSK